MATPSVYTVPARLSFVDALAAGLMARHGDDPAVLADVRVLLPTRRAARALADAFLRLTDGRPTLLPQMTPIGDVDEDAIGFGLAERDAADRVFDIPPAISPLRRQLLLARLIEGFAGGTGNGPTPAQATRLAAELGRLIDQIHTERLDVSALGGLAPAEFAEHWQRTLDFLAIVTDAWPRVLAEEGAIDPADRRNRLIEAQIDLWREAPPTGSIYAAGSTGTLPATADLLALVAGLDNGEVVLPGFDTTLDEATSRALGATHPQFGMVQLLFRFGIGPADVPLWPIPEDLAGEAPDRAALLATALRPPGSDTPIAPLTEDSLATSLDGVGRIDCPGPQEEARVAALILRQTLAEDDTRTAALVTPDRALAARVAAELRRWNIRIDDSAGRPLGDTAPGAFVRLLARMAEEHAAPIPLLAALKHPLAALGREPEDFRHAVRVLERKVLRGPRPAPGIAGLKQAVRTPDGATPPDFAWLDDLEAAVSPLVDAVAADRISAIDLLRAHADAAEALAATTDTPGAAILWRGDAGDALAGFFSDLAVACRDMPSIGGSEWPGLFDVLLENDVVRPRFGGHPRLHIWGALEARLQRADVLVLGGLNEGTWPAHASADPWMSRPMRSTFGLPPHERRIGLAAHDFVQAMGAQTVFVTRAAKVDGTPTVPSRWLSRLDIALQSAGLGDSTIDVSAQWLAWQEALDRPDAPDVLVDIRRPAPVPPVAARPRELPVTRIETLMRDPYAIYAERILKLRPLDPIDADPGAADRGSIIHDALDNFLKAYPDDLPPDPEGRLLALGERVFEQFLDRPGIRAFWWPRFVRLAHWFVEIERVRRPILSDSAPEIRGEVMFDAPAGAFKLTGKADRIDLLSGGGIAIIDYKTGGVPSKKEIVEGRAPQLPLEAAMAAEGGFGETFRDRVVELAFWRMSGAAVAGEIKPAADDIDEVANAAWDGVRDLIAAYDDPDTPYFSRPDGDMTPRLPDYDHLARVREWSGGDGGGES